MQGITKAFGPVHALRGADFTLASGEVHALLGENGAGKTTLMHVLFGLTPPDAGHIEIAGQPLHPGDTRASMARGIGLVHQHFSQVPRMTVAENVRLGAAGFRYDAASAARRVRDIGGATGLTLDPAAIVEELPVGLRQRLEIVKALAHDARILLLDEPTASLTPGEVDELFAALRRMQSAGMSIVLITHRLREVQSIADRVTVLRQGATVLAGRTADCSAEELSRAMVGAAVPAAARSGTPPGERVPLLSLGAVTVKRRGRPVVVGVSLEVRTGEIVGIAAVEGNGQRELLRAIAGLERASGSITIGGAGPVGFVPEDRQQEGLILDFSVADNFALGDATGFVRSPVVAHARAAEAMKTYDIRAASSRQLVRTLSGGNQQKLVLGRVLARNPGLVVAENPTRGLDIRAIHDVHETLRRAARAQGMGVLFYSTDLDEVLALADRIGVMAAGRWHWVPDEGRTRESIGALMLGAVA